ncbi:ABC transporter permease [Actinoplanes oblitus]|uniref:ABC transporter permease n=1 Tax=Actinoplanes oblitus TaxID=3040509 RepID=A0ABY8WLV6_9ACTN|nr:FtsX-like permease family protein [Actinoplanes oblitus]WIM98874.1 ABC transporter permease [Actinoplanes oblitus]
MIALVFTMVWARRGPAVVLAVLAAFAVAPAVAAPAYLRAADRVVAAGQVAGADPAERAISLHAVDHDRRGGGGSGAGGVDLTAVGSTLGELPGFRYVYAAEYPVIGLESDDRYRTRLAHRQDACAHLTMVTGRCLLGEGDLVVGERTAQRQHLRAGQSVSLTFARFNADPDTMMYEADGVPKKFFVAGTYRVPDPGGPYWGAHSYFAPEESADGSRPGEPAFTGLSTLDLMDHGDVEIGVDGYAGPGALDVDHLPALRDALVHLEASVADLGAAGGVGAGGALQLETSMPALMARIDEGHTAARRIVPVPAVALIVLACLAILLAVGAGAEARRPETAVIALRGVRLPYRWWLAAGENLVAVLAGAIAGVLAGQWLVDAVVAVRWPGVGADPDPASLEYAPLAAAAVIVAVLVAQGGPMLRPVAELLRRAPMPGRYAGLAVDILVAALAVAAAAQLALGGGDLAGIDSAAPALVMLAAALLVARAVRPLAARSGHRALERGRLGRGLTGLLLSRRRATGRVLALLIAAVAVSGYMVAASQVAARGRQVEADLGAGADRVLSAGSISRSQLIAAVRAVDPDQRFAMAAVRIPQQAGQPPLLAVDTGDSRLATVANWPGGAADPRRIARALHPAPARPLVVAGPEVTLDLTAAEFEAGKAVSLDVTVAPADGRGPDQVVPMGVVQPGRHTYRYRVAQCAGGCRVNALRISGSQSLGTHGVITVHHLGDADPARWRISGGGRLGAAPDGLRVEVTSLDGRPEGIYVQPVSTPWPLPMVATGTFVPGTVSGLDYRPVPVTVAGRLPAVPAVGTPAMLIDLEYADLVSTDGAPIQGGQIWLSRNAPADARERFAAKGVEIVGDLRAAQIATRLDRQGPAVALGYAGLVGVLVVVLAAGVLVLTAAAGRDRQAEDLAALRAQGLSRAEVRRAALWAYPMLVAAAVPAGLAIALGGWAATGWALPLAGVDPSPLPRPGWPGVISVVLTGVVLLVVLGGTALLAGRRTLRRIR